MGSTWVFCSFKQKKRNGKKTNCVRKRQEFCLCVYFFNWYCMAGKQVIQPWSWGCVMPWHGTRASPAKITWLGHQRQGQQHIRKQGPALDDWVMRTLCLQASWHNSELLCHLCSHWFLLLCFPFGWGGWGGFDNLVKLSRAWASVNLGAAELLGKVLSLL